MIQRYETASGRSCESRSETIKRMKKGKALWERRQAILKSIDEALKTSARIDKLAKSK